MPREPKYEGEVITLFLRLADFLGWQLTSLSGSYPDAEFLVDGSPTRVEFELKSSGFKGHGHQDPKRCDVIVCWEHDAWHWHPWLHKDTTHIKIVELRHIFDQAEQWLYLSPYQYTLLLTRGEAVYMLTTMANTLQSKTKEVAVDDANLEHVFPQNPDASWDDTTDLESLLWHLGNLTILGTKLNRKAANSDFHKKATKYYSQSEIKMTKEIPQQHTAWTPADILKRARLLFPLVLQIWRGP